VTALALGLRTAFFSRYRETVINRVRVLIATAATAALSLVGTSLSSTFNNIARPSLNQSGRGLADHGGGGVERQAVGERNDKRRFSWAWGRSPAASPRSIILARTWGV
jgi:hypothetical protein